MESKTIESQTRRIILEENALAPKFVGAWTVGEVLAMADALARWAQSLQIPAAPPETLHEAA